ncbi:transcriptional regulator GcvA [Pseudolysobacter antarcticus]|uniref:Transcriptional regulator GcvA n=2 Tax=Pseudolysobacter antarcticus TaxID=2511995 RepID=A0A411HHE7_9GAMM|nr:transcriptional regulator GcvA [Pseudolysobacter antarcticus]
MRNRMECADDIPRQSVTESIFSRNTGQFFSQMTQSWQHLPALRTLRIFEAAARHLNYTRAALELHLTHGAVSHQIQALETQLKLRLFERNGRQTQLTDAGQQLVLGVRESLDALSTAIGKVRERESSHVLTVSVTPSFASAWLVERLGGFLQRHAEIQLNLQSNTTLANFRTDNVDVAIRYGAGVWANTLSEKLLDDELFPVMSPRLRRGKLPRTPAQLAQLPLIISANKLWSTWFASVGLDYTEQRNSLQFDDAELALQAAIQGQGVALGRSSLVAAKLRAGTLVAPFRERIPSRYAYYLVYTETSRRKAAFQAFREWLLAELISAPPLAPPPPPNDP